MLSGVLLFFNNKKVKAYNVPKLLFGSWEPSFSMAESILNL